MLYVDEFKEIGLPSVPSSYCPEEHSFEELSGEVKYFLSKCKESGTVYFAALSGAYGQDQKYKTREIVSRAKVWLSDYRGMQERIKMELAFESHKDGGHTRFSCRGKRNDLYEVFNEGARWVATSNGEVIDLFSNSREAREACDFVDRKLNNK